MAEIQNDPNVDDYGEMFTSTKKFQFLPAHRVVILKLPDVMNEVEDRRKARNLARNAKRTSDHLNDTTTEDRKKKYIENAREKVKARYTDYWMTLLLWIHQRCEPLSLLSTYTYTYTCLYISVKMF